MANHVRRQIRDAVFTSVTGLATTASRAYKNRVYPVREIPGLIVYNGNEDSEPDTIGTRSTTRVLNLNIEAYATSDDVLDEICKEVEVALSADTTLGGLSKDCYLISTTFEFAEGDDPSGVATMTYQIPYRTSLTAPDTAL